MAQHNLAELVERNENDLLTEWLSRQKESLEARRDLVSEAELRTDSRNLLSALRDAFDLGAGDDINRGGWAKTRDLLGDLSRRRAAQGFSPSETATFVFSLKQPLFQQISKSAGSDAKLQAEHTWTASGLLDKLGLYTMEVFLKTREQLISRQQQEMLELSTPVVELWHGVLAVPLIGTLDSNRTQVVMQNLLEAIVGKSSTIAIIDITGVPTVAAARLMGAVCIISGIRPQIAQTIIHLGVDLGNVITKATLADAFQIALRKAGLAVTRV